MSSQPSREIAVPFQIGSDGGIAYTSDRVKQVSQHILSAVATNPGERVMRPSYGVPLTRMVFEPDDPLVEADIRSRMEVALGAWVKEAQILEIRAEWSSSHDAKIQFLVSFRLPGSGTVHYATVYVGGTVDEISVTL